MKKVIIFSSLLFICFACNTQVNNNTQQDEITTDSINTTNESNVQEIQKTEPAPDSFAPYFTEEKSGGKTWIQIKDALSGDQTGFYVYFRKENNIAKGLRMRVQYADQDIYQFSADGVKYTYKSNRSKGSDSRFVEGTGLNWYDSEVKRNDLKFLQALIKSENANIAFSDGTSVPITNKMKEDIQKTLDYFESLGGQLPTSNMVNIRRL